VGHTLLEEAKRICCTQVHSSCVVLDLGEDTISMETLQTSIAPNHSYGCKVKFRSLYLNWIRMCIFLRCWGDNQFQEIPMESKSLQPPRCLSLANKLQLFVLNTRRFFTGLRTRPQNNQVTLKRISLAFRSLLKRREVNSQFSKINTVEQQLLAQMSGVISACFCLNLPFKCGLYCWC